MTLEQIYYSPSGNAEIWLEKPDGYFTPEQWTVRVRDMQMTLEEAKAAKLAEIDSHTSAAILAGFDYILNGESLHFSYDSFDQQNFADTANACLLAQSRAAGLPESVVWNAYRGQMRELVRLTLTAAQFLELYAAGALAHKAAKMAWGGERKAAVEAAQTRDALREI